jgi:hypothetical protein
MFRKPTLSAIDVRNTNFWCKLLSMPAFGANVEILTFSAELAVWVCAKDESGIGYGESSDRKRETP